MEGGKEGKGEQQCPQDCCALQGGREVKVVFSGGKRSVLYIGVSMGMQGKRLMAVFGRRWEVFWFVGVKLWWGLRFVGFQELRHSLVPMFGSQ